ncbi:hypothetical protein [Treponema zioleckii]|uniref:hypothetical protein n=1 Tax=Treponema zioleckii TaxID=331680 RepID=UPI00168B7232|nr:hypothetical protein [Treponema zioleckii]
MAQLGRRDAEKLIAQVLTEYAKKIMRAKKKDYAAEVQPLFTADTVALTQVNLAVKNSLVVL